NELPRTSTEEGSVGAKALVPISMAPPAAVPPVPPFAPVPPSPPLPPVARLSWKVLFSTASAALKTAMAPPLLKSLRPPLAPAPPPAAPRAAVAPRGVVGGAAGGPVSAVRAGPVPLPPRPPRRAGPAVAAVAAAGPVVAEGAFVHG